MPESSLRILIAELRQAISKKMRMFWVSLLFPHLRYQSRSLKMLDTISSQYDSFIYWRMPIPRLDMAELEGLGLADMALYKPKGGLGKLGDRGNQDLSQEEDSLLQFNSFNFWRAPIASISSLDFDLI
ncbi:LOW QUALITY PROTEIN: protein AF1q [Sylvia borin]